MQSRSLKYRILILFLLGLLLGGGAGWSYYHFIMAPKYDSVSNATRL